jgi:hypothetical protein
MKIRSFLPLLLVSTVACGGAANRSAPGTTPTADAARTYPIHLHRHAHVGDRARVVFDVVEDNGTVMHLSSTGKEISNEHKTRRTHLDGVVTTVALDARQDELRSTLDVTTLIVDSGVVLQNKRVDITKTRKADDAILTVDGSPVSLELRKALRDVLDLRVGGPSDDEIFGTSQPQHVGAHWPINGELARADLAEDQGADVSSTKISGETTFAGVKHVGSLDALELKAEMHIDGLTVTLPQPGATCDPGQAKAVMSKLVAVAEDRGVFESHMAFEMAVRIHVPTPAGDVVIGDVTVTARHDDQTTRL